MLSFPYRRLFVFFLGSCLRTMGRVFRRRRRRWWWWFNVSRRSGWLTSVWIDRRPAFVGQCVRWCSGQQHSPYNSLSLQFPSQHTHAHTHKHNSHKHVEEREKKGWTDWTAATVEVRRRRQRNKSMGVYENVSMHVWLYASMFCWTCCLPKSLSMVGDGRFGGVCRSPPNNKL